MYLLADCVSLSQRRSIPVYRSILVCMQVQRSPAVCVNVVTASFMIGKVSGDEIGTDRADSRIFMYLMYIHLLFSDCVTGDLFRVCCTPVIIFYPAISTL